ncbi:hypothetical protein KEM55_004349 [Ascosphaera atra]|nr:hypothetical protein KEM55_004349 [Ascosphaera atra]
MSLPTPTILLANVPHRTLVGFDLLSFQSTPNFHGIRDIPRGPHFFYAGTSESFSLRSGEWIYIGTVENAAQGLQLRQGQIQSRTQQNAGLWNNDELPDIRLRYWDTETETFNTYDEEKDTGRQEAMRLRANIGQIWSSGGLLSYTDSVHGRRKHEKRVYEVNDEGEPEARTVEQPPAGGADEGIESADWSSLSSYITPSLLTRIFGPPRLDAQGRPRWTLSSGSSAHQDTDQIPGLSSDEVAQAMGTQDRELKFLPIDLRQTWREGAVGRERTEAAQDRSWYLNDLLDKVASDVVTEQVGDQVMDEDARTAFGESQILGEMQTSFLMVLTLMNYSCMEQWKRILSLLFTCRNAVIDREAFYVRAIRLLLLQLQHFDDVEGGLFETDGDSGGLFLRKPLSDFIDIVEELDDAVPSGVKAELSRLEDWVKKEFDWELKRGFIVTRGMLRLEDGEEVEMDLTGADEEDEQGEYAPVVVDLDEATFR